MILRILFVMMTILSSSLLNPGLARDAQKIALVQYDLGKDAATPFTLSGFSTPEKTHIWSDGKQASITFSVISDGRRIQNVIFKDTSAYITNNHPQTITVFLNGTKCVGTYKYSVDSPIQTIKVNIPSNMRGHAKITFRMPDAAQPSRMDVRNKDPRMLGISLSNVEVTYKPK